MYRLVKKMSVIMGESELTLQDTNKKNPVKNQLHTNLTSKPCLLFVATCQPQM